MAEGNNSSCLDMINSIKSNLILNESLVNGPLYQYQNKQIADLYLTMQEDLKAIYHLTEAHAATLRQQTVIKYDYKDDQIQNPTSTRNVPMGHGIKKTYVQFNSEWSLKSESGLLSRLREMPSEWTVVQLTTQFDAESRLTVRKKDSVYKPTPLLVTRLPCGSALDESCPVTMWVDKPRWDEGMPTLYEIMHKSTKELLRTKASRPRDIRKARETASDNIKNVVDELSQGYLREWKCLLLGSLCSSQYSTLVKSCIDDVLNSEKHVNTKVEERSKQLLYCVAGGCTGLTSEEIKSALSWLVSCKFLYKDLASAIEELKQNNSVLMIARRNPVILIVDEILDILPWEMVPIVKKHPMSRVPSIHFLHALYHEHKDHIVKGCRLVDKLDIGFYILNPNQDLKEMEARMINFFEKRIPEWNGLKGVSPTQDDFCQALTKNNIFVYCGHFNGTHFLSPEDISSLRVVALPLLFGCSSVALQDLGGLATPSGVTDKYFMAGSACVIGMQWTVTSDDADCMAVMILNNWLPGKPVDLSTFRSQGDNMFSTQKEPELLRLLRHARDAAHMYFNAAALIARGIPIKMVDS